MNRLSILIAASLAFSSAIASTDKPTDTELNDWKIYLRSVSLPAAIDICPTVLPENSDYAQFAHLWLEANSEQIKRGRDFAIAGSPKDRDFDQFTANMLADFKEKFQAKPADFKLKMCKDSLETMQKSLAKPSGA